MKKLLALILISLTLGSLAQPFIADAQTTPAQVAAAESQIQNQVTPLSQGIQYIAAHTDDMRNRTTRTDPRTGEVVEGANDWINSRNVHITNANNIARLLLEINPNDQERINRILNGYNDPSGAHVAGINEFNTTDPVTGDRNVNFANALRLSGMVANLLGPERAQRTGYTQAINNARNVSVGGTQAQIDKEKNDLPSCGINFTNLDLPCALTYAAAWLLNGPIASITAWISWVGNSFFNVLIKYTVLDFATYGNNEGVKVGWRLARDLVNISLIFILLYIAISTILQLSVDAKSTLPKVIMVALLVNFSAFFTGVAIDASNILATQFYYMAGGNSQTPGANQSNDITTQLHKGMDATMASIKLPGNTVGMSPTQVLLGIIPISLGKIALDIITTIIMFFAAGMFLTRFITLIVLIVLSPLAFAAQILPKTRTHWNKWTSTLISQAFFAPAFLFMFYVTVRLTQQGSIQALANAAQNGNGAGTNLGFVYSVIYSLLVNGLMVASLLVAKNLGAEGASAGLSALKKVGNYTRGVLAGTALGGAALGLKGLRTVTETVTSPSTMARGIGTAWRNFRNSNFSVTKTPIGSITGIAKAIGTGTKNAVVNTSTTARNIAIGGTIGLAETTVGSLTKSAAKFDPVARNIARAISPNLSDKDEKKGDKEEKRKNKLKELENKLTDIATQEKEAAANQKRLEEKNQWTDEAQAAEAARKQKAIEEAARALEEMTPKEIAGLNEKILKSDAVVFNLGPEDLKNMMKDSSGISRKTMGEIFEKIKKDPGDHPGKSYVAATAARSLRRGSTQTPAPTTPIQAPTPSTPPNIEIASSTSGTPNRPRLSPEMRNQLANMGYTNVRLETMSPEEGQNIINEAIERGYNREV